MDVRGGGSRTSTVERRRIAPARFGSVAGFRSRTSKTIRGVEEGTRDARDRLAWTHMNSAKLPSEFGRPVASTYYQVVHFRSA